MSDTPDLAMRAMYRSARRTASAGLAVNLALGLVKLVGGVAGRSFALISDAVNSIGDSLGSAIVLFGLHVAEQPADPEHPYGHSRAEAVASLSVGWLIAFSAVMIGWGAIANLAEDQENVAWWTLVIALVNVVVKEVLYRINLYIGKRIGSQALVVNAWDHRSDGLSSLAALLGIAVAHWGGPAYAWADEAAALVVVVAILWSAFKLLRASAIDLMDRQADPEVVDAIRQAALEVPGVRKVEKLRVRQSGMERFADIHVEVDPQTTVEDGHEIGHEVKRRLVAEFAALRDVLVHLEPETQRAESPPHKP